MLWEPGMHVPSESEGVGGVLEGCFAFVARPWACGCWDHSVGRKVPLALRTSVPHATFRELLGSMPLALQ